ncbi:hypothetical protein BGZ83_005730 [Gryganskiella cystojenkinii]|nr:hypothetical protein BGZ83_005730 [Gryganskiella cystojenkinii]
MLSTFQPRAYSSTVTKTSKANRTRLGEGVLQVAPFLLSSLDRQTVLACLRVNRTWKTVFEPLIWHDFILFRDHLPPHLLAFSSSAQTVFLSSGNNNNNNTGVQGLHGQQKQQPKRPRRRNPGVLLMQRNAHLIRRLEFYGEVPLLQQLLPGCTRLEHLEVTRYNDEVKQLLEQNTMTLQSFICKTDPLTKTMQDPVVIDKIWFLLKEMPHLRLLELDTVIVSDYEGRAFGSVVTNLRKLSLVDVKLLERPKSETAFFENLRTLVLDRCYVPNEDPQKLLLFQLCVRMENLVWKTRSGKLPIVGFVNLLNGALDHTRNRTRLLTGLDLSDSKVLDVEFSFLVKMLPVLTRINASNTLFGTLSVRALVDQLRSQHLEQEQQPQYQYRETTNTALLRIRELNLLQCPKLTTMDSQALLTTCAGLRVFYAPAVSALEMGRKRWVCLDLEELDVAVAQMDRLPTNAFPRHRAVYAQLAVLTKLKVLRLGELPAGAAGHDGAGRPSAAGIVPGSSLSNSNSPTGQVQTDFDGDQDMADLSSSDAYHHNQQHHHHHRSTTMSPGQEYQLDLKLDSGLGLLSTLTRIRELHCERLRTAMEFGDLQWVVQHWRTLERLVGSVNSAHRCSNHNSGYNGPQYGQQQQQQHQKEQQHEEMANTFLREQLPGLKTFKSQEEAWMSEV